MKRNVWACLAAALLCTASIEARAAAGPILFVTQVPQAGFVTIGEAFGTISPSLHSAPRGGDLWLRYPDGTMRNLTLEAGYGKAVASQDNGGIAVRQPVVHWSGTKAMFAMVVGAPDHQYDYSKVYHWQLYEVTGLEPGGTAVITRVPCQPGNFNNIAPAYGSDDAVIFVSDKPRNGAAHLYPQRDEYESTPIETGLWKIDPVSCRAKIIEHAPSGVTYPSVDSYGRILFTKWDHLQRDQQADADSFEAGQYGSFNYASEASTTIPANPARDEVFPEYREKEYSMGAAYDGTHIDPTYPFANHTFNQFFPWVLNQDGSEEETLNHVGRHELGGTYSDGSYRADNALIYVQRGQYNGATYFLNGDGGTFHLREDPAHPGLIYGVNAPEFATGTGGDLIRIMGAPGKNPELMKITRVAAKDTYGRFRNPLPLSDGRLLVVHTPDKGLEANTGTATAPVINYRYRIRELVLSPKGLGPQLTAGIHKCIAFWDPDQRVSWCGNLWELDPVEVAARPVPRKRVAPSLPAPEAQVLASAGVNEALLRNWLHSQNLALIVSRNVTTRDRADRQQPYNLKIAGSATQTIGLAGKPVYTISHFQLFQADQIRGYFTYGSTTTPQAGRRVLPMPMHDPAALAAMAGYTAGPQGAVPLAADGSMAAFVPAGRAMAWQLVDGSKTGYDQAVVRERNWLSFRPGERRVCTSCHGLNTQDQAGNPSPANPPQALGNLLAKWKAVVRNNCPAAGGTGTWSYGGTWSACDEGTQYQIQACSGGNGCCTGMPKTMSQACP